MIQILIQMTGIYQVLSKADQKEIHKFLIIYKENH